MALQELVEAVEHYDQKYRHPECGELSKAPLYDLRPPEPGESDSCEVAWPTMWPNCHNAGVYAFLDEKLQVLYIGKASLSGSVGGRLSSRCVYGADDSCHLKKEGRWTDSARYVWSVAVPDESPFEASALEEFLIREIRPPGNRHGTAALR